MSFYEKTVSSIFQKPTVTYGLKYFPSLEPVISDDQDSPAFGWPSGPEVSVGNRSVLEHVIQCLGPKCKNIVEIGVHRNSDESLTTVIFKNRLPNSLYLGIDLDDKSYLDDPAQGTYTIKSNSHDQRLIRNRLNLIGIEQIDLLMIDGWHSVNTCVNDWQYVDLLSPHGVVVMHDTNSHPGPIALFEAIDEKLFDKQRFCTEDTDMGIALIRYR